MPNPIDITGQRFGKLVAISPFKKEKPVGSRGRTHWSVICDCGQEKIVATADLTTGHITSCRGPKHNRCLEYLNEVVLKYEGDECLTWPFAPSGQGYGRLTIHGKAFIVSRFVCTAIHGEPPTPIHQAAHSCGRGHLRCVTKRHLRWATPKENAADKLLHEPRARRQA